MHFLNQSLSRIIRKSYRFHAYKYVFGTFIYELYHMSRRYTDQSHNIGSR